MLKMRVKDRKTQKGRKIEKTSLNKSTVLQIIPDKRHDTSDTSEMTREQRHRWCRTHFLKITS